MLLCFITSFIVTSWQWSRKRAPPTATLETLRKQLQLKSNFAFLPSSTQDFLLFLLPPPSPPWVSQSIYLSCSWLWGKHICDWNPAEVQKEEKNSRALEVLLYVNLNQSCSDSFLIPSGISRTSTNFPIDFWKYIPTADDDKVHQSALNIFIILGLLHDLRNFWMQICNSMVFNLMRGGGGRKWIWGHSSWKIQIIFCWVKQVMKMKAFSRPLLWVHNVFLVNLES